MFSTGESRQSFLPGGIGASIDASEYAKLPPHLSTVFGANASRLGLLGSHLAGAVTVVYTNYLARSEIFKQPIEMMSNDLPEHFFQQILWGNKFCEDCGDIEHFLIEFEKTGSVPSLTAPILGTYVRDCATVNPPPPLDSLGQRLEPVVTLGHRAERIRTPGVGSWQRHLNQSSA